MALRLVMPEVKYLESYLAALEEGNFTTMQLGFGDASREEIAKDPAGYLRKITDTAPFTVKRNNRRYEVTDHELLWIVNDDNNFLGTVALRFAGDDELLTIYAGHIGVAVRPALLNKGYGVRAIKECFGDILDKARARHMDYAIMTCDEQNRASARLIEYFGGVFENKVDDVLFGGTSLRYRIAIN